MEMGESLVASYFKYVKGIRMVVHNAPFDQGQGELDLIAIEPKERHVYLCEVATHIQGMLYGGGYEDTVSKVRDKLKRARQFALTQFPGWTHERMLWSPVVPKGLADKLLCLETELAEPDSPVTIVINHRFTERVEQLRLVAKVDTAQTDEPAFRMLQILERLRKA